MKKVNILRGCLLGGAMALVLFLLCNCSKDETYADQKKKERKAVAAFVQRDSLLLSRSSGDYLLRSGRIKVISQAVFEAQDSMTDVSRNEYVLFKNSGVYMQIVRKGNGQKLRNQESAKLIVRYWEYNILGDSLMSTNIAPYYNPVPEYIDVKNHYGTFTASFDTKTYPGGGAMYHAYKSTAVPNGWLVPLSYIALGRQNGSDAEIAKVRLIVPHTEGTTFASEVVSPMFYEITYQRMR